VIDAELTLDPGRLTLAGLRGVADGSVRTIRIPDEAWAANEAARALVEQRVAAGVRTYGVNTGFGPLSDTTIPDDRLAELQRRMILSHCVGTGAPLADGVVRQVMVLKLNTLLQGRSGVRRQLIELLAELFDRGIVPVIPSKGSVGASGDLAPLAHLAAAMLGIGEVRSVAGRVGPVSSIDALARAGLSPVELAPKEGLAMVNGTQVSLALALDGLFAAEAVFAGAVVAGALSVEAAAGSEGPFDERIQAVRGQTGQRRVARVYASLLDGSGMRSSDGERQRVQDAYSLRCQPQVMGAALDLVGFAAGVFEREINAVTDNPLVFAEDGEVLYGGNFHAQPVGMAADVLALALAEVGSMSERRIALLLDASVTGLPPFLAVDPGVDSGFMVGQVAAAALASENKALAHPVSIDSLPTAGNQEDIVSMAAHAGRRLGEMADNAASIVAIELLAASHGIGFRRPLRSSGPLEAAIALIREVVPPYDGDRYLKPDLEAVRTLVRSGAFQRFIPDDLLAGTA
jgi:histidine ammonia-lyase